MISDTVAAIPTADVELANAELRRNPLYDKFTDERKGWYIEQSLAIGTQAAEEQLERGAGITSLYASDGVELIKHRARTVGKQTALRSEIEFSGKGSSVTVYLDSIDSIYENSARFAPPGLRLSRNKALEMHLAHEFFHYLEFSSGQTVSQRLPKLEVGFLGKLKRRIEVNETCEIAAQAFAKRFCGLEVLPTYYDLLYIKTLNQ